MVDEWAAIVKQQDEMHQVQQAQKQANIRLQQADMK